MESLPLDSSEQFGFWIRRVEGGNILVLDGSRDQVKTPPHSNLENSRRWGHIWTKGPWIWQAQAHVIRALLRPSGRGEI